jgi:hypothetical protein
MTALALAGLLPLALLQEPLGPLDTQPDSAYVEERQFNSPVTGEKFFAPVLMHTVPTYNYDYDRCPHPPINTLAYALVIDPETGYAAAPDVFERPCDWSREELAEILGAPKFKRGAPEALPWAGAYPWEKFENAAQLARAANRPAAEVAGFWLLAAWSVRLDVISGHNEFDAEVARVFAALPRRRPDPAKLTELPELQLAQAWQEMLATGQLDNIAELDYHLALAWLYRSRGELPQAQAELDALKVSKPDAAGNNLLDRYLTSSIELERSYLKLAGEWLGKAWDNGEVQGPSEAWVAFLLGETCRRTGAQAQARQWYGEAAKLNRGTLSVDLIKRQLKLAGGNAADAAVSGAY